MSPKSTVGFAAVAALLATITLMVSLGPAAGQQAQKVKLGVYMESLCPDTRRFFLRQLLPTYREIGAIMELELVPFGHARTLGNGKMICQHGPRECEGNRQMACILARAKNQSVVVETFGCMFRGEESLRSCLENNAKGLLDFADIDRCSKADESYKMMEANERLTGRLGYVPHLTVNGESSSDIQDQAEHELKRFMCKQYKGQQLPQACRSA